LGNQSAARQTVIWGVLFNLVVIALMLWAHSFPHYVLPIAYSWTACRIAEAKQLKKETIAASSEFRFQSNWKVFSWGMLFLILTLGLYCEIFLVLRRFHVIQLR
jgi:hypothetical protein